MLRQWQEGNVNGKLRKHTRNNVKKTHNKFLRNENSELQSQVNRKATCQGRNKGSWCCVHGNYSICKLCWRAELTIKRIQQCKPSLSSQMKEICPSKDNISKWGEKAKEQSKRNILKYFQQSSSWFYGYNWELPELQSHCCCMVIISWECFLKLFSSEEEREEDQGHKVVLLASKHWNKSSVSWEFLLVYTMLPQVEMKIKIFLPRVRIAY